MRAFLLLSLDYAVFLSNFDTLDRSFNICFLLYLCSALTARSPRQLAAVTQESLLTWLVRMLTSTPQECEAHAQATFAARGTSLVQPDAEQTPLRVQK